MTSCKLPFARRRVVLAVSLTLVAAVSAQTSPPATVSPPAETTIAARDAEADKPVTLDSVIIKGQALSASAQQPFSVKTFDKDDFRDRQVRQVEQLYREVAGMEVRGLGYGNVANSITLRSFSGGGHGSDIGFVVDGLPLNEASSHADGYADVGVLIPLEIASMSVFKGPVSALYGNFNRAGLIAFETRKGGRYSEFDIGFGSYGTADVQGAFGAKVAGATVNLAAQVYRTDGYRPHSDSERGTFAGRVAFDISADTQLAVATRLYNGQSNTASIITQAQFNSRDRFFDLNPNVQNDSTDKVFKTLRADLSHRINTELKALAFVYGTQQTFRRSFTRLTNAATWQQREEAYDRDVLGFGANLNGEHKPLGATLKWVAGVERYQEKTLYTYADALNNGAFTATTLTSGVSGGIGTLNRNLRNEFSSLFGQAEWQLHPLFKPTAGVRYDRVTGRCDKAGVETRTGASAQCFEQPRFNVSTPKLGVRSTWIPNLLDTRVSVAEGFALPSDAAKFTNGLKVDPTKFRQTEIGATIRPNAALYVDVSAFRIDSRDEIALIVPATLTYANIGKTRREGLEAEIRYTPAQWLELSAALATFRTKVRESLPGTPFLVGSELTGVARHLVTVVAAVKPVEGVAVTATGRAVGRYAISQPTATVAPLFYDGYKTLDLMATYDLSRSSASKRSVYLQVANVTDRRYATSAGQTGGTRTYNPAPPRTFMVGASLSF
jgi:iron complex outermembrane recepter protein